MATQKPITIPADFEERHRLALTLCQHLGIKPDQVELGSLRIELGPDARHIVTWSGRTRIDLDELSALILIAHGHDPIEDTDTEPT